MANTASAIEFGALPSGWALVPVRSVVRKRRKLVGADSAAYKLLSLTLRGVIVRDLSGMKGKFPASFETYQEVEPGDLVLCMFDVEETPRTVGLSRHYGMITGAYDVYRSDDALGLEYLTRLLLVLDENKSLAPLYRGLRKTIPRSAFESLKVPMPTKEEQGLIVRYLDHAELRIAKAIAAKQRMIALLEEKRQVVAEEIILGRGRERSELVETGIPWLGQIPVNWSLTPCRAYLRRKKILVGKDHKNHVLLSLTLRGLVVRDLSQMKGKFPSSFETYQQVNPGDFVFCLFDVDETPRTVGLSKDHGMITGAYDVFECADDSLRQYLYEYYLIVDASKKLKPLYRGLRKTVPSSAFASMRIPIPPPEERAMLVEQMKRSTLAVENAIDSLRNELLLLKEYRTRLISDVVTGKLDVREQAANLPEIDPMELAVVSSTGAVNDEDEESSDVD